MYHECTSGRKWDLVVNMLIGEFHHNIDEKNRIVIPNKLRELLGSDIIITKGIEKCLYVYSLGSWDILVKKLEGLSFTKRDARVFTRYFYSGALDVVVDKSGRAALTKTHLEYACITKECIVVGVGDRLEIWSKENFEEFLVSNAKNISDIAEDLFEV